MRNLNWNSPGRPLRLIDTLFVELESAAANQIHQPLDGNASDGTSARRRSRSESLRSRDSDGTSARKERRHQIPGLRQTPYLKLLLLRCDDTDTYKSISRKEIREWIKANTPPSQKSSKSSKQENHDAFEWMILHVVLPDADRKVTWPHRNSTKILGYLRDDFNSSSKNAVDRVGQIPATRLSSAEDGKASISDSTFGKQAADAWDSSLATLKQLILSSFDQRVRQYEDDIKEKRAQRSLPGWNFCTFFVLKEGLSRGFESVGLVEDALSGYDELHAELDSTIRSKHSSDGTSQDATIFRDATPEILAILKDGIDEARTRALSLFEKQAIDPAKKPYRDLILSSDISMFDFKTYIFAREVFLLQRIGAASKSGPSGKKTIEPRFLCDICQRSTSFIASAGTILRDEVLAASTASEAVQQEPLSSIHALVMRVVSAWTYEVSYSIMDLIEGYNIAGSAQSSRPLSAQTSTVGTGTQAQATAASSAHFRSLLSSRRAALVLTARRALQHLGAAMEWKSGWEAAAELISSLEKGETTTEAKSGDEIGGAVDTTQSRSLRKALSSASSFRTACLALTELALQRQQEAGDLRGARSTRVDLAIIRFSESLYAECAETLETILKQRLDHAWTGSQAALLVVLAQCYQQLHRSEDFVRTSLRLVSYLAHAEDDSFLPLSRSQNVQSVLRASIAASEQIDPEITVNLEDYVDSVKFDSCIQYPDDKHGFSLRVWLKCSVFDGIRIDSLAVGLSRLNSNESFELQLTTSQATALKRGSTELSVLSDVVCPGIFEIRSISISIGKIRLSHVFDHQAKVASRQKINRLAKDIPRLRVWLPASSPNVKLDIYDEVDLDRPKCVALTIEQGSKPIDNAHVQLRAASAGLRLHTAQARIVQGHCTIADSTKPGLFEIADIQPTGEIKLAIPFQMDYELKSIGVRCELTHTTTQGQQKVSISKNLAVVLPLGVNVQDVFKANVLFSKFSISSSTGTPLRVLDYDLQGNPGYRTHCPTKKEPAFPVFGRQPACLTYKITHEAVDEPRKDLQHRLRLGITYQCLDEEIMQTLKQLLVEGLLEAGFDQFRYLLEEHIEASISARLTNPELESVALLREVKVLTYDQMQWDAALLALRKEDAANLSAWLRMWHANNQTVLLPPSSDRVPMRKIQIPVDVPPMQVVHTAKLDIINVGATDAWHVGDAIPAELRIKLTTQWARKEEAAPSALTFNYELDAPPDAWIIGGQRRGLFSVDEGQEIQFPVLLLPQRAGHLMLPALDMRSVGGEPGGPPVHCEVDYRSQGESVLVMSSIEAPTVGINVRGERRSWLIDAS